MIHCVKLIMMASDLKLRLNCSVRRIIFICHKQWPTRSEIYFLHWPSINLSRHLFYSKQDSKVCLNGLGLTDGHEISQLKETQFTFSQSWTEQTKDTWRCIARFELATDGQHLQANTSSGGNTSSSGTVDILAGNKWNWAGINTMALRWE